MKAALGVSPPCSLIWCNPYKDGGSYGGALRCRGGDTLLFAVGPGAVSSLPAAPTAAEIERYGPRIMYRYQQTARPLTVFLGGDHWLQARAREVTAGSEAESLFLEVLTSVATPGVPKNLPRSKLSGADRARVLIDLLSVRRELALERRPPDRR